MSKTCGDLQRFSRAELQELFGKFGAELYELCRGIDHRAVEPDRERKSLSNEETFLKDLNSLGECEIRLQELFGELMAELAQKEPSRNISKIFVKLKFADFTRTTVERAGLVADARKFPHAFGRGVRTHWQKRASDGRRRSFCRTRTAG